MRFRTVLFDLDGTLVDHFTAIHRCHAFTLKQLGLPEPSMETVRRAVGAGFEVALQRVLGVTHADLLPEAVKIYQKYWETTMLDGVALLPGAFELITELHQQGIACAVFTNKHGPSARRLCKHLKLTPLLAGVFGAFDTPWFKPNLAFTHYAVAALGAKLQSTCLVGDSPYDIEAARLAGFPCFAVTTGTHTKEELCAEQPAGVYPDLATLNAAVFIP